MHIRVREDLQMRPLKTDDAPQVFEVIDKGRNYLRQWLVWVDWLTTVEQMEINIAEAIENSKRGASFRYGIYYNNQFIGVAEVKNINKFSDSAQIGYWLAEEWQGKGIMTDCVKALTSYCFNELNLHSVHISCAEGNTKSRAIPERLHFVLEGALLDCMRYYGVYYNEIIYGMLENDWNSLSANL